MVTSLPTRSTLTKFSKSASSLINATYIVPQNTRSEVRKAWLANSMTAEKETSSWLMPLVAFSDSD